MRLFSVITIVQPDREDLPGAGRGRSYGHGGTWQVLARGDSSMLTRPGGKLRPPVVDRLDIRAERALAQLGDVAEAARGEQRQPVIGIHDPHVASFRTPAPTPRPRGPSRSSSASAWACRFRHVRDEAAS